MWTASITSISADATNSIADVTIVYSDGDREKTVTERISDPDSIKQIVSNGLKELNRVDKIADLIANPPLGEVDFGQTEQTQEQIDAQAYQTKRQALIQAKQDLDIGLIDQETFETKVADVQTLKP
jgi:hypothetical protein